MGKVTDATRAELEALRSEETAPGLAALALTLAEQLDGCEAPTSAAVVARELRGTMSDLRKLAPVGEEGDALDELTAKREERLRGA